MQKWEYAELAYDDDGSYHYLILFNTSGTQIINLTSDENLGARTRADARRRTMAQLGLQGWELANSYSSSPHIETLYFKRPLPE